MTNLKQKVAKGAAWVLCEKFSCQLVQFVVAMILARLLTPSDYGTVALLTIFTAVASVLADSGFGNALVQKKEATDLDFNSVFYLSLTLGIFLYCILFVSAPCIASFYELDELSLILRITALIVIFNAINSVQTAELRRKMKFHLLFRISLISTVASGVVGIWMAFGGFGIWALVCSSVVGGFVGVVSRWYFIAWRPKFMFSFAALRPLFRFGWKMTVSSLLETGYRNLYGVIIGRVYSPTDLAYVNKGNSIPHLIISNITGSLRSVTFPVLAQLQNDIGRLRDAMRRMMLVSTFIVFPMMVFCGIVSRRMILILFGDQWLFAVPYMQLACFSFAFWPFHTINLEGIQAIGRSDVYLKLEMVKKILGLLVLVAFMPIGVLPYMIATSLVMGPLSLIINGLPNASLLKYPILDQIYDILPTALIVIVAAVPTYLLGFLAWPKDILSLFACIIIQLSVFCAIYILVSCVVKQHALAEILEVVLPKVPSRFAFLKSIGRALERRCR